MSVQCYPLVSASGGGGAGECFWLWCQWSAVIHGTVLVWAESGLHPADAAASWHQKYSSRTDTAGIYLTKCTEDSGGYLQYRCGNNTGSRYGAMPWKRVIIAIMSETHKACFISSGQRACSLRRIFNDVENSQKNRRISWWEWQKQENSMSICTKTEA